MAASCGCLASKPNHDFEINETRNFDCEYDGIQYLGTLRWDGEHFHIHADGLGYKDGIFMSTAIRGIDNDCRMVITSPGLRSYDDWHVDLSRTIVLKRMIDNRVEDTRVSESR